MQAKDIMTREVITVTPEEKVGRSSPDIGRT